MFGGLGKLGDLGNMIKAAKDLQGNMAKMQEELAQKRYEGEAGGGMVKVVLDGKFNMIDVNIDEKTANDVELLEDLIKGAMNMAVTRVQEGVKEEMQKAAGGMNLPGLTDMMSG